MKIKEITFLTNIILETAIAGTAIIVGDAGICIFAQVIKSTLTLR